MELYLDRAGLRTRISEERMDQSILTLELTLEQTCDSSLKKKKERGNEVKSVSFYAFQSLNRL